MKNETIYEVDFVKYFMGDNDGHGTGLIIKGGVGTAKTTMLSMIVKLMLEYSNFAILTNIRFVNEVYETYPKRLMFISNIRQYLEYYCEIPDSQPILLIWDDSQGNTEFKSTGVRSEGGEILSSFLIYVRKFSTSFIYIAHQSYIPRSIKEGFEPYFIFKTKKDEFVISKNFYEKDSDSYLDSKNLVVKMLDYNEFNEHYLPILSHAFTDFVFNIDWFELKQFLTQYEVGENLKKYVRIYLDNLENSEKPEMSKYEQYKEMSYTDIYITLCIKRNTVIPDSTPLNEIMNNQTITRAKKFIKKNNIIHTYNKKT